MNNNKLCLRLSMLALLCPATLLPVKNATAAVELVSQVKISDQGLHFDGADLDYGNVGSPDTGEKYDYFFGRNISAHGDAVKTYKHYVFMTWYRGGKFDRHVMLSRYNTLTGAVKTIEFPHQHTGFRGDPLVGESHNTIGLSVSPINGTIHMVYDMHAYDDNNHGGKFKDDFFRYSFSVPGAAEVADEDFTLDKFVKDTSAVSQGSDDYKHLTMTGDLADKSNFARLTYPKFFTNTDGTLLLYMRLGGNNNGAYVFNRYDAASQKWSKFTFFNYNNQKTKGNDYNWGLYGNMKYVNGKLRVGFQQRSNDNTDKYTYQNGVYYAYSDHPEGVGEWKNHQGEPMTWPLVNSDEIKVFEPGDYISHTEANSVYIVPNFDWTVTAKGDIHMISQVRSTDRNRPDFEQVNLHSYKPAGADEFIISTDFAGAAEIYTAGDNIYIVGLQNGRPYVEKAKGGTNNFTRVYEATDGPVFDHGTIHIEDGKLYYYLMEKTSGTAMPLYLQIIDLDIDNGGPEGYEFSVNEKETVTVDGVMDIAFGAQGQYNYRYGQIYDVECTNDVFGDPIKGVFKSCYTREIADPSVKVNFTQPSIEITEGYEELIVTVEAASVVAETEVTHVDLYLNDELVRQEKYPPYIWGDIGRTELLDLPVGEHVLQAFAEDERDFKGSASVTVTVVPAVVSIEAVDNEQVPNVASNMLDGNVEDSSRWSAQGYSQQVVFDLGATKQVTGTQMWTYQDRAYQYKVWISDSPDSGFTLVADASDNNVNNQPLTTAFTPSEGRYIKLEVLSAFNYASNWVSINEFKINTLTQ